MDSRIRTLVENGVKLHQRSLFVIVGDKGRDQVRQIDIKSLDNCFKYYAGVFECIL